VGALCREARNLVRSPRMWLWCCRVQLKEQHSIGSRYTDRQEKVYGRKEEEGEGVQHETGGDQGTGLMRGVVARGA